MISRKWYHRVAQNSHETKLTITLIGSERNKIFKLVTVMDTSVRINFRMRISGQVTGKKREDLIDWRRSFMRGLRHCINNAITLFQSFHASCLQAFCRQILSSGDAHPCDPAFRLFLRSNGFRLLFLQFDESSPDVWIKGYPDIGRNALV